MFNTNRKLLLTLAIWLLMVGGSWSQFGQEVEMVKRPRWGSECPSDCQCHVIASSRTALSKWLPRHFGPSVKAAVCLIERATVATRMFRRLPSDTQSLTLLQTQEGPPVVLMDTTLDHLTQLLTLEIRAHSHYQFALGQRALKPLRNLRYLQLKSVDLSSDSLHLSHMKSLGHLSLDDNQLDRIDKDLFNGLSVLEELEISNNGLHEVPALSFVSLPALKKLRLPHNKIQTLDANSFVGLDELRLLDLSHNNISDLSVISFPPLAHLVWLHLADNPIKVLFLNAFHSLNTTRQLTLGHFSQAMHLMKYSFNGLHSVESLILPNVENYVLEKHTFHGLSSIKSLTIRGQVKVLGVEAFFGANTLRSLVLRNCQLRKMSMSAFKGLKELRVLDLAHNSISKLPLGLLDSLKSLKELQLQHNGLHFFPNQLVLHLSLHVLRLSDNPWHCTCAMAKWDRAALVRVRSSEDAGCEANDVRHEMTSRCRGKSLKERYVRDPGLRPTCNSPLEVKGKKVFEALKKDLHCFSNRTHRFNGL